jgi:hypothetical protein
MKSCSALICAGLALLAAGCSTVTVKEPIGRTAPHAELKALEGLWKNDDGNTFEVRLTKSGDLSLGQLEWNEEEQTYRAVTSRLLVTQSRKLKLLYLDGSNIPKQDGILFCRYEIESPETVRLYYPDVSVFKQAVESGELSGTIARDSNPSDAISVHLSASADQVDQFLKRSGDEACFKAEPSITFTRLRRFE